MVLLRLNFCSFTSACVVDEKAAEVSKSLAGCYRPIHIVAQGRFHPRPDAVVGIAALGVSSIIVFFATIGTFLGCVQMYSVPTFRCTEASAPIPHEVRPCWILFTAPGIESAGRAAQVRKVLSCKTANVHAASLCEIRKTTV